VPAANVPKLVTTKARSPPSTLNRAEYLTDLIKSKWCTPEINRR